MLIRQLQKYIYHRVYRYTETCHRTFFRVYLRKYIKKHIKFRTINKLEFAELCCANDEMVQTYETCGVLLDQNTAAIVDELLRANTYLSSLASSRYALELFIENHKHYLAIEVAARLKTPDASSCEYNDAVDDITMFSFDLRDRLSQTHITAKMKIHEHLVSRMPIYFVCVTGLLIMKLVDLLLYWSRLFMLQLSIMVFVYVVSIYMVYLRVFQSVVADTKKVASEQYKIAKRKLYLRFTVRHALEDTYRFVQTELKECVYRGLFRADADADASELSEPSWS